MFSEKIEVSYKVYSTDFTIKKALHNLDDLKALSFDLETNAVTNKATRALAKKILNNKDFSGQTELDILLEEDKLNI